MLFFDRWQEIFETLGRNKLRTALTSLAVGWGIFMLIILLGAGQGLQNQVQGNFADDAINSIWVRPGRTQLPYNGLQPGRTIRFTNADYEAIKKMSGVDRISGRLYMRDEFTVNYGAKSGSFDVRSVHPDHQFLEKTIVTQGRFINDLDIAKRRKVCAIGVKVAAFLFGSANPIGEYITVHGIQYKVIGTFEDEGGEGEQQKIFLPISTAQLAYNAQDRIDHIIFTVKDSSLESSQAMEAKVRALLAERLNFSPDDERAVRIRNNLREYHKVMQIFDIIRLFMWIVGIGTITAGVVGVSNILLISVAERRVEFGVRKALGATPISIVAMVLKESLLVTGIAGYCGLIAGVGLLELANRYLPKNDYILNPEVDLNVAAAALVLLVAAGAIAGFFPARSASRVNPVVALRNE